MAAVKAAFVVVGTVLGALLLVLSFVLGRETAPDGADDCREAAAHLARASSILLDALDAGLGGAELDEVGQMTERALDRIDTADPYMDRCV
jgi:hypothetical protein